VDCRTLVDPGAHRREVIVARELVGNGEWIQGGESNGGSPLRGSGRVGSFPRACARGYRLAPLRG
jgi:hypothetical protein